MSYELTIGVLIAHVNTIYTCQRLGITQHLIRSGIARLEEVRDANGNLENLYVRVCDRLDDSANSADLSNAQIDRESVLAKGKEAAGKLLIDLQIRKSTADGAGAREFYTNLTKPMPGWEGEIRNVVLRKKLVRFNPLTLSGSLNMMSDENEFAQPRKIFVQPNTFIVNGKVILKEYPLSTAGAIESFIERKL